MREMVIYDMDKTITRKATYSAFLLHVARGQAPWRLLMVPVSALLGLLYLAGVLSRSRLKEWNQRLFIGADASLRRLSPLVASYAERVIADNIQPGALRQIAADRDAGCLLVMATASYELYAAAIAERLGFDAVIGTCLKSDNADRVYADIEGENCYAEAKLGRIAQWQDQYAAATGEAVPRIVRTYSDHVSDLPMLMLGEVPVAVNPHDALARHAKDKGWRIEDWSR